MRWNKTTYELTNVGLRANECWLDALTYYYGDTVLASNRREVLTRERLLELLGKTEETIGNGCSISDVMPFFHKFRIPIRIYSSPFKCISKYEPENRNPHFKVFFGLVKDMHIYTMNFNLKELEQHGNIKPLELQASSNYFTSENKQSDINPPTYTMIDTLDDLLKILWKAVYSKEIQIQQFTKMSKKDKTEYQKAKQDTKEKHVFHLVYKTNNLNMLAYEIKKSWLWPYNKICRW